MGWNHIPGDLLRKALAEEAEEASRPVEVKPHGEGLGKIRDKIDELEDEEGQDG